MLGKTKSFQISPIDFTKPWWHLVLKQKGTCLLILMITASTQIFNTLVPFTIAYVFESGSTAICVAIFALWLTIEISQTLVRRINPKFQLQCIYSIYENAHLHLLSVDPQYHVHRSSGAILSKIDRAARGFEDILDYLVDEYTPLIVGVTTIIIVMAGYSLPIAGVILTFLVTMLGGAYFFAKYASLPWEKKFIQADDVFKTVAVENLAQVQLIRSTFATDYRTAKLKNSIDQNMKTQEALWLSYSSVSSLIMLLYLSTLFILAMALLKKVQQGLIPTASAIGLFLSYTQGTRSIVTSTKLFRKSMRSLASIRDLFAFIPSFGKQQIPVLDGDAEKMQRPQKIEINAQNIVFDYGNASLFNNHTLAISGLKKESNKLYGIIGPSGCGKSTLLSILGGQLKPVSGAVFVDNIDIYQVGDAGRRQLIALQGQISTNLQGSVRSNLLLGLPEDAHYNDQELLTLLDDVGLLSVLNAQQGLETKIGEGGLNLSGGQRQRLNFAALYLRATYYNPALILIDEPTSSLDEISEAKITAMLSKLSTSAITFVIAHRLKTISEAAGLIDLSMLSETEEIKAYTPQELQLKSEYYCELMQGSVALDM